MRVYKAAQQASSRRKFHILKYELLIVHRRLQGCIAFTSGSRSGHIYNYHESKVMCHSFEDL